MLCQYLMGSFFRRIGYDLLLLILRIKGIICVKKKINEKIVMKKAVFLDRDGTLNIDHGYVHKIDDFQFIEGSIDALKALKEMGYLFSF